MAVPHFVTARTKGGTPTAAQKPAGTIAARA